MGWLMVGIMDRFVVPPWNVAGSRQRVDCGRIESGGDEGEKLTLMTMKLRRGRERGKVDIYGQCI